ncbi:hypothetical protein J8I29_22275 [Labrys sp. LIt4]|uniref:hypothetical protein n=1 Tax=Labrys sp. LIt4 TaxID=2821355 RepID=UPI001ADF329F|nr:hypothetical protein [Labrys sp. LIt4]MBP0582072.1 hypothetical protein [Labrys sp. LIt4]
MATPASDTLDPLLRDLLAWLSRCDRPYAEVMDAWRTSCPRLPVWEEANDRGLVSRNRIDGAAMIGLTEAGRLLLRQEDGVRSAAGFGF